MIAFCPARYFVCFTESETMFPNFGIMNNVSRRIAAQGGMPNIMNYDTNSTPNDQVTLNESPSSLAQQQRFNNIAEGLLYNNRRDTGMYPTNVQPQTLLTPIQPYNYPNMQTMESLEGNRVSQLEALATTPSNATPSYQYTGAQQSVAQLAGVQLPAVNPTAQQTQNAAAVLNTSLPRQNTETFLVPQYMQSTDPVIQTRIITVCTIVFMFAIFMFVQVYLSQKRIQLMLSLYKSGARSPNDLDFIIKDVF